MLKDFKQLKPQKKNKSCCVLPSFVMISDISIKPICLALPTTLFLLCCLRGVQFLCVENSAKFAKLRFSFTERELVNCAGSTKMVQSYLLDAPHGAWAGHAADPDLQKVFLGSAKLVLVKMLWCMMQPNVMFFIYIYIYIQHILCIYIYITYFCGMIDMATQKLPPWT